MGRSMSATKDESLARDLLCNFYSEHEIQPCSIQLVENDPPDLLIQWPLNVNWGVEVTRLYHAAPTIGNEGRWDTSEAIYRALERLGEEIEFKTRPIRDRGYTLSLHGPSPLFSSSHPSRSLTFKEWKKKTTDAICEHIEHGTAGILKGFGFSLKPGEPGNRWTVSVSTGSHDVELALNEGLYRVFQNKEGSLDRWTVKCTQRWLLILNCYPIADDADAAAYICRHLDASTAQGFDGVFWSGFPNRELKPLAR